MIIPSEIGVIPDLKITKRVHFSEYIDKIVLQVFLSEEKSTKNLLELITSWKFKKEGEIGKFPLLDIEQIEILSNNTLNDIRDSLFNVLKFKKEMNKSIEETKEADRRTKIQTVSWDFREISQLFLVLKIEIKNSYILSYSKGEVNCISFDLLELTFNTSFKPFYSDENLFIFDTVERTKIKNANLLDSDDFVMKQFEELLSSIDPEDMLKKNPFFAIFNHSFENIWIDSLANEALPSFRQVKWIEYRTRNIDREAMALLKEIWEGTTYFYSNLKNSSHGSFEYKLKGEVGNKICKQASSFPSLAKIFLEMKTIDPAIRESCLESLRSLPIFSFTYVNFSSFKDLEKQGAEIITSVLSNYNLRQLSIHRYDAFDKSFLINPNSRKKLIEHFDENEWLRRLSQVKDSGMLMMPKKLF
jgi:hypothetical protein